MNLNTYIFICYLVTFLEIKPQKYAFLFSHEQHFPRSFLIKNAGNREPNFSQINVVSEPGKSIAFAAVVCMGDIPEEYT